MVSFRKYLMFGIVITGCFFEVSAMEEKKEEQKTDFFTAIDNADLKNVQACVERREVTVPDLMKASDVVHKKLSSTSRLTGFRTFNKPFEKLLKIDKYLSSIKFEQLKESQSSSSTSTVLSSSSSSSEISSLPALQPETGESLSCSSAPSLSSSSDLVSATSTNNLSSRQISSVIASFDADVDLFLAAQYKTAEVLSSQSSSTMAVATTDSDSLEFVVVTPSRRDYFCGCLYTLLKFFFGAVCMKTKSV